MITESGEMAAEPEETAPKTPQEKREALRGTWCNPEKGGITHNVKGMHSSAGMIPLRVLPSTLPEIPEVFSGCLSDPDSPADMDFNTGAEPGGHYRLLHHPDPSKFDKYQAAVKKGVLPELEPGQGSLYDHIVRRDPAVLDLLSKGTKEDPEVLVQDPEDLARDIEKSFKSSASPSAVNRWVKQVYFPVGDGEYHMLGLAPSSLLHAAMCQKQMFMKKDRRKWFPDQVYVAHGGGHAQNVGTLFTPNPSSRLLPSLPPSKKPSSLPFRASNLFVKWGKQSHIRNMVSQFRDFLRSDPPANLKTRSHRDGLIMTIIGSLLDYRAFIRESPEWPPRKCSLPLEQKAWLDPDGYPDVPDDQIRDAICGAFAHHLGTMLPEFPWDQWDREHWYGLLKDALGEIA